MAHIKRQQMKKQEKFIDIILMEPELKSIEINRKV
jgi:hypothetical protein